MSRRYKPAQPPAMDTIVCPLCKITHSAAGTNDWSVAERNLHNERVADAAAHLSGRGWPLHSPWRSAIAQETDQ